MDNVTVAKINLFAVLRNLEDLCAMDSKSKELIKDENIAVEFNVPEVGSAVLTFKDGVCTFAKGKGKSALKLYFASPEHFNKLIDGEKTIPIFYNVFKVSFLLKTFTALAERLSYYLKPKAEEKDELLKDAEFFEINTSLTAYTAFFAMAEIANSDYIGKCIAKRMSDGVIQATITDGPAINLTVKNNKITAKKGVVEQPKALMGLADMQFAHDLLNGKTSSFIGMGTGQFNLKGAVDMLEQVAKLLSQVSIYLS